MNCRCNSPYYCGLCEHSTRPKVGREPNYVVWNFSRLTTTWWETYAENSSQAAENYAKWIAERDGRITQPVQVMVQRYTTTVGNYGPSVVAPEPFTIHPPVTATITSGWGD